MNPIRSLILFPCYQWEDFPRSLPDRQAAGLLAGWTVLWHPVLLKSTGQLPQWCRADQPPDDLKDVLAILPVASENRFPDQLKKKIADAGGVAIGCSANRREMIQQMQDIKLLPESSSGTAGGITENDFFALGYCYLQVQLMTRQLRYATHLDQAVFEDHCLQAANAWLEGNSDQATKMLQSCFDQLGQERDHFYAHDTHVIEVILLAATTLGAKLDEELTRPEPLNLLASGKLLSQLQNVNPTAWNRIRERLVDGSLSIIGGEYLEPPHPLLDQDSIRRDLERGRKFLRDSLQYSPKVFGRYRDGMTPHFPAWLKSFGYQGCVLVGWESGSYPEATQVKSAWESADGTPIDTLSGAVIDGASADSFLGMGARLGQSLDHDHVSTIMIAHWPGLRSDFLSDHAAVSKFTPALGKWIGADRYFEITAHPYHQERLPSADFKPNYLVQAAGKKAVDPISGGANYHRLSTRCFQLQSLAVLREQLAALTKRLPPSNSIDTGVVTDKSSSEICQSQLPSTVVQVWETIDSSLNSCGGISKSEFQRLEKTISTEIDGELAKIGKQISAGAKAGSVSGALIVNTSLVARRLTLSSSEGLVSAETPQSLYAQLTTKSEVKSIVDMPPCGYFWSESCGASSAPRGKMPKSANLASADATIGNEFMEIQIDRSSGHLKALHVPNRRGNRLSLQLGIYDPRGGGTTEKPYSLMKADKVMLGESSPLFGELQVQGGLWFDRNKAAEFQIRYRLWRGSRVLQVNLDIDLKRELLEDPWASYVALRSAWVSESAVLTGIVGGNRQSLSRGRLISPLLVEIDEVEHRTSLLTGGLAYHRRHGERFLDSLLMVRGETAKEFHLGIGVDLPQPIIAAETFLESPMRLDAVPGPPRSGALNWFFAAEPSQAQVQLLSSLYDQAGNLCGVRVSVRELTGKLVPCRIRCLRDISRAYRSDADGKSVGKLTVEKDSVLVTLSGNEQCRVDIVWAQPQETEGA